METDNHINYIEFKAHDIEKTKTFYSAAFAWIFMDYGPSYTAFSESGLAGGFELSEEKIINGVLIVLYHTDLDRIKSNTIKAGGAISKDIFSFPGGHRFYYTDLSGNELAVWSDN